MPCFIKSYFRGHTRDYAEELALMKEKQRGSDRDYGSSRDKDRYSRDSRRDNDYDRKRSR